MKRLKSIKTNLFIAGLLIFSLVFLNVFTSISSASSTNPDVKIPEIPEIEVPEVEIPKIEIPKVEIPENPKVKIPERPKVNVNANTKNNLNAKKSNNNKNQKLTINANDVDIQFVSAKADTKVKGEYDQENYLFQIGEANNQISINIMDMDKDDDSKPIKIYIPNKDWQEIELNTQDSSFSAKKIFKSGKIILNMSDSNADIELPKDFKGSMEMNLSDTNVEVKSVDKFKDAVFTVNSLGKISLPNTVKKRKDGTYVPKSKKTLPITINADKNSVVEFE